jgi:hypothetical protein
LISRRIFSQRRREAGQTASQAELAHVYSQLFTVTAGVTRETEPVNGFAKLR